jgi:CheY-like chemotaxis protein
MSNLINTVLLIDDDITINYFHNRIIQKNEMTNSVLISQNGKEGIQSIKELNSVCTTNDKTLIFLDLNMPIMNGWEFLEELKNLNDSLQLNYKIFVLSSSINPDDQKKAENNPLVNGYLSKPLSKEILDQIKHNYF